MEYVELVSHIENRGEGVLISYYVTKKGFFLYYFLYLAVKEAMADFAGTGFIAELPCASHTVQLALVDTCEKKTDKYKPVIEKLDKINLKLKWNKRICHLLEKRGMCK